jgi:hypothetical protein
MPILNQRGSSGMLDIRRPALQNQLQGSGNMGLRLPATLPIRENVGLCRDRCALRSSTPLLTVA